MKKYIIHSHDKDGYLFREETAEDRLLSALAREEEDKLTPEQEEFIREMNAECEHND
jgi:hypothetical protein